MDITIPAWYYFLLVFMSSLSVLGCGIMCFRVGYMIYLFVKGFLNEKVQQ